MVHVYVQVLSFNLIIANNKITFWTAGLFLRPEKIDDALPKKRKSLF